jgi:hypothetical protein
MSRALVRKSNQDLAPDVEIVSIAYVAAPAP